MTPFLFLNESMEEPRILPFGGGSACVFTTASPLKPGGNEDCAALIPVSAEEGVLVVADGVGGVPGGNLASRLATQTLCDAVLRGRARRLPVRESILQGFEDAASRIEESGTGSATTLAVVHVVDSGARTFHAGDSEILVVDEQGKVLWRTLPHSPVGYAVESGLLDPQEAIYHEARHLVSNVLGSLPMSMEVSTRLRLGPGSTVLLTSDGLVDNLHLEEIVERVSDRDLLSGMRELIDLARERMLQVQTGPSKPDDLTLVVYRAER